MRIALLCPTRERVDSVKRLVTSILNTTTDLKNITLYFGIDADDPVKDEVASYCTDFDFIEVINIENSGEFLGLGKIWNNMVKHCDEDIFAMIGDDMTFDTKNWDVEIINEFEKRDDNIILVHGNSGTRSARDAFADNSFIHRVYYDTFGYYVREEWKHWYHDTWLHDVFTKLNRRIYRHDIVIFHHHPENPNSPVTNDAINERLNNSKSSWFDPNDPHKTFRDLEHVRVEEVNKLKELIND